MTGSLRREKHECGARLYLVLAPDRQKQEDDDDRAPAGRGDDRGYGGPSGEAPFVSGEKRMVSLLECQNETDPYFGKRFTETSPKAKSTAVKVGSPADSVRAARVERQPAPPQHERACESMPHSY